MLWLIPSLLSAVCIGTSDALAKKALETNRVETIAWVRPGWGLLVMIPIFFLSSPPSNPLMFWKAVMIAIPFEVAACLALHTAIRISPLSLCIPYLAFTPVFLLGAGWIFLKETVTTRGIVGVCSVTMGALLIQRETLSWRDIVSHRIFPREKGPLLMLLVAFIFSITTVFAKKALVASSPFYFSSVYYLLLAACLLPFQWKSKTWARELVSQPRLFSFIGIIEATAFLLQFHAMQHAEAAYVIAIKRLSLLLSVIYGWLFFQERHIVSRLLGSSLMMLGAILIAFA